jgi:uncharacterized protein (TIGR02117 family)
VAGVRRALRILLRLLGVLLTIPLAYLVAALLLGLIPANAGWQEPKEGVRIFVRTNGLHTWIVVPMVEPEMDWRPLLPGADLKDPRWGNGDSVAIGYGNRQVYLETPTWADLKLRDALSAVVGWGPALVHADHDHRPKPDATQRPIMLTHPQYARLAAFIRTSFRYGPNGRPIPVKGRGYGPADAFYEATGRYSALRTCNEWTGEALRRAGVRTGLWTPVSQSVMWRLDGGGGPE